MSDKQLGAAPEAQPESQPATGWVGRLRAQPGFRAAAVAFFLTVILGAGGPAAYAYWSQSATVTVSGATARPLTPVPAGVKCQRVSPATVTWPAATAAYADPEVRYIVTLKVPALELSAVYALPRGVVSIDPWALYKASAGMSARTLNTKMQVTATVRSAIVKPSVPAPLVNVAEDDLQYVSAPSQAVNMWVTVSSNGVPSLSCA